VSSSLRRQLPDRAGPPARLPAIVIEDLNFADAREQGREPQGSRPSRGARGRGYRALVAGLPTAGFRDRLVQMTANADISVIAVDPAYTSRWGAEHWLGPLRERVSPVPASGHHAAAVVIGRPRQAQRQPPRWRKTATATRTRPPDQAAQDRPGPPASQDHLLLVR
jgi:hypothetical protein